MLETGGRQNHNQGPPPAADSRWGVVLLCHGSQRGTTPLECSCSWQNQQVTSPGWCRHCPSTPQGLQEVASRLQARIGPEAGRVLLSCLEFIQPHPQQAIQILADQGIRQVVILPYLLGNGKHATLELEEALAELRTQWPQAQLHLANGLGVDSRIAELVVERIGSLDGHLPASAAPGHTTGVLLVKAGTKSRYDDCRWLQELGWMVEDKMGNGYAVAVAQSHYGDPTMPAAVARLVEERRVSALVGVPYLFFPGMILRRNVLGEMTRLQEKYPHIPMRVTPPLGVDDRLVEVAVDRIKEVWSRVQSARA